MGSLAIVSTEMKGCDPDALDRFLDSGSIGTDWPFPCFGAWVRLMSGRRYLC